MITRTRIGLTGVVALALCAGLVPPLQAGESFPTETTATAAPTVVHPASAATSGSKYRRGQWHPFQGLIRTPARGREGRRLMRALERSVHPSHRTLAVRVTRSGKTSTVALSFPKKTGRLTEASVVTTVKGPRRAKSSRCMRVSRLATVSQGLPHRWRSQRMRSCVRWGRDSLQVTLVVKRPGGSKLLDYSVAVARKPAGERWWMRWQRQRADRWLEKRDLVGAGGVRGQAVDQDVIVASNTSLADNDAGVREELRNGEIGSYVGAEAFIVWPAIERELRMNLPADQADAILDQAIRLPWKPETFRSADGVILNFDQSSYFPKTPERQAQDPQTTIEPFPIPTLELLYGDQKRISDAIINGDANLDLSVTAVGAAAEATPERSLVFRVHIWEGMKPADESEHPAWIRYGKESPGTWAPEILAKDTGADNSWMTRRAKTLYLPTIRPQEKLQVPIWTREAFQEYRDAFLEEEQTLPNDLWAQFQGGLWVPDDSVFNPVTGTEAGKFETQTVSDFRDIPDLTQDVLTFTPYGPTFPRASGELPNRGWPGPNDAPEAGVTVVLEEGGGSMKARATFAVRVNGDNAALRRITTKVGDEDRGFMVCDPDKAPGATTLKVNGEQAIVCSPVANGAAVSDDKPLVNAPITDHCYRGLLNNCTPNQFGRLGIALKGQNGFQWTVPSADGNYQKLFVNEPRDCSKESDAGKKEQCEQYNKVEAGGYKWFYDQMRDSDWSSMDLGAGYFSWYRAPTVGPDGVRERDGKPILVTTPLPYNPDNSDATTIKNVDLTCPADFGFNSDATENTTEVKDLLKVNLPIFGEVDFRKFITDFNPAVPFRDKIRDAIDKQTGKIEDVAKSYWRKVSGSGKTVDEVLKETRPPEPEKYDPGNPWIPDPKGYYKALALSPTASQQEVTPAYRTQYNIWFAAKWKEQSVSKEMQEAVKQRQEWIERAFEVLSDPQLRREYDMSGRGPRVDEVNEVSAAAGPVTAQGLDFITDPLMGLIEGLWSSGLDKVKAQFLRNSKITFNTTKVPFRMYQDDARGRIGTAYRQTSRGANYAHGDWKHGGFFERIELAPSVSAVPGGMVSNPGSFDQGTRRFTPGYSKGRMSVYGKQGRAFIVCNNFKLGKASASGLSEQPGGAGRRIRVGAAETGPKADDNPFIFPGQLVAENRITLDWQPTSTLYVKNETQDRIRTNVLAYWRLREDASMPNLQRNLAPGEGERTVFGPEKASFNYPEPTGQILLWAAKDPDRDGWYDRFVFGNLSVQSRKVGKDRAHLYQTKYNLRWDLEKKGNDLYLYIR